MYRPSNSFSVKEKILAVDDNTDILYTLKTILSTNFEYFQAENSSNAMSIIRKNKINLVIIDIMLEEKKTGIDLFHEIVEYDNTIKCIFLSALNYDGAKRLELKSKGAYDYLTKPFEAEDLLFSIRRVLGDFKIKEKKLLGYGEIAVEQSPIKIQTVLGSCVAVIFYDKMKKLGGMTHIMYPRVDSKFDTHGAKEAVLKVYKKMQELGCTKTTLDCSIYGGSHTQKFGIDIGKNNVDVAKSTLIELGIKINREDIFGEKAREVTLDTSTGKVNVILIT